jgi:hypothetical protein
MPTSTPYSLIASTLFIAGAAHLKRRRVKASHFGDVEARVTALNKVQLTQMRKLSASSRRCLMPIKTRGVGV